MVHSFFFGVQQQWRGAVVKEWWEWGLNPRPRRDCGLNAAPWTTRPSHHEPHKHQRLFFWDYCLFFWNWFVWFWHSGFWIEKALGPGIEPGSSAWQAEILTTILPEIEVKNANHCCFHLLRILPPPVFVDEFVYVLCPLFMALLFIGCCCCVCLKIISTKKQT